jgi:predicted lipase
MEGRLTVNKEAYDMSMFELSHNSCYVKEGRTRYRDYETDIDARELTKLLLKEVAEENNQFNSEDEFDEKMLDYLTYGINTKEGLIAVFYREVWAMADLRERLNMYENLEEQDRLIKLPCTIGDTLYTNFAVQGWYFREKNKPYEIKVVFIGINGVDNFINVAYENGNMWQFNFSDIGKRIFLTREEAEKYEDKKWLFNKK